MIDADLKTLHIRCGSDIRDTLTQAGFAGDFLEYSDPISEGPVPDSADLTAIRARYLAAEYGLSLGQTEADIAARLHEADQRLTQAHSYQRVVLWFEHDSHDQLVLARCLSSLAQGPLPARLELICIDQYPEVQPRFNGLGQLEPSQLAALWPGRSAVTAGQISLGQSIWKALRQDDPTQLLAIAETGTPALPVAARALRRHLQELPDAADGLSLTQRIILAILTQGPDRIGKLFAAMVNGWEPLVFMGDLGVLATIQKMALTDPPVLTIEPADKPFARVASITDTGRRVLGGGIDYLSLKPPQRWVGGVRVDGRWRWNEALGKLVG